ncbi:MAG: hypothetical protein N2170_09590, partial [Bacteroidia bacterium]|nr:hypothetical protein [Bacteroidia bacterium]
MALTVGPVRLADPRSPWNGQRVYLHIVPQGIERVESTSAETDVWVSPGWVDLVAWTNQPQIPTAESFSELAERANRGGFTTVGVGGWWGWHEPELLVQLRSSWELLPITFLPLASWADPRGRIAPVESLRVEGAFGWTL